MRLITQEDPMGCGIACVATVLERDYTSTRRLFDTRHAATRGYYCRDLIQALRKKGRSYRFTKAQSKNEDLLDIVGTIVFIERSKKYPEGHYLVRTQEGWMNPWINFPHITPAQSGFQKKLPGKAQWILFSIKK